MAPTTPRVRKATRRAVSAPLAEALADAGQAQVDFDNALVYARDIREDANGPRVDAFRAAVEAGGSLRQIEAAVREATGGTGLDHSRIAQLLNPKSPAVAS